MLALTISETWSRFSYQRAYDHLGDQLEGGDERGIAALDAADVKACLGDRKPSRTEDFISAGKYIVNGATHLEVYSWYTLNPLHRREMFVYYDAHGPARKVQWQVLSIQAEQEEDRPLLSQKEQQIMDRMGQDRSWEHFTRLTGMQDMNGMPGTAPRGGSGGRRGGKPATEVNQPDEVRQPQADPTKI